LAKFRKDRFFIFPVAATVKEARATADKTLIIIGPVNDFYVSSSGIHHLDSSIALLTARSWYLFASSPAFLEIVTALSAGKMQLLL
jgi:hypothetical protein